MARGDVSGDTFGDDEEARRRRDKEGSDRECVVFSFGARRDGESRPMPDSLRSQLLRARGTHQQNAGMSSF